MEERKLKQYAEEKPRVRTCEGENARRSFIRGTKLLAGRDTKKCRKQGVYVGDGQPSRGNPGID